MPTRQFYTIGYDGRKPEEFLSLLKAKDIKAIVDVRLRPDNERQRCYVANIRHFLDKNGDFPNIMPNPARKMAIFLTRIISSATEAFLKDRVLVSMQCNRKGCHEEILVWLDDLNKDIEWFCPECGDNGFISNWRGTKWDKTSRLSSVVAELARRG
ncbi:MAG: hypothetical protein KJ935_03610 [Candidatus Omnitrophica bacterium]|nr:hypothetical protein [Candidatus Omnitrophota bacterium]